MTSLFSFCSFSEARYDLKDIIAFQACDMYKVADLCGLYFQEVCLQVYHQLLSLFFFFF